MHTRRAFLQAAPSALAAVTVTIPALADAPDPDAILLNLEKQMVATWENYRRLEAECASNPSKEADAKACAAYDDILPFIRAIEREPAHGIAGLRAKARAVEWCCAGEPDGISFGEGNTTDVRLAAQIIRQLLTI